MIDNAMITVTDIFADNGVIHQIDAVLLPPEPEPECVDLTMRHHFQMMPALKT